MKFLSLSITQHIRGFHITEFPLWKLGCLLDENWVEEDVLNGMAELLYFRLASASKCSCSDFLFLPTSFFNDARYLYAQQPQVFSQNIAALRDRLCGSDVQTMGFIVWDNNHFAAYFYNKSTQLLHNDSMGREPASDVLNIFSWILTGLSNYPPPHSVQKGALALQSSGSGSCGIAAHNFVESLVDESVPYWDNVSSLEFRKKALQEMIIYHDAAAQTSVSPIHQIHKTS